MSPNKIAVSFLAVTLLASGCAYVPKPNVRLEEARTFQGRMIADSEAARLAPAETKRALEAFERAVEASNTLQDPALVDHLAYVARQRSAIATETARRVAAEQALGGRLIPSGSRS